MKLKPAKLDEIIQKLDEEAFEAIDCLNCANCSLLLTIIPYVMLFSVTMG
jgi:hypothetical protein